MGSFSRRSLLQQTSAVALTGLAHAKEGDPWRPEQVMQPHELAQILGAELPKPLVICVGFPVLYRQRRIAHAVLAGPASKPDGLAALRSATAQTAKSADITIYCGCCPMEHCPNIRPAFAWLKEAGFRNVHVLELPSNLRTDWTEKGFPVEPAAS